MTIPTLYKTSHVPPRRGCLPAPYHFGRMDIIASTLYANGIPNNGTDEADHFIQMAGAWMRPGYLLPVFDLEAGRLNERPIRLTQFAIDFSDRIYEVMGIRPAVYTGGNYATITCRPPLHRFDRNSCKRYPTLWIARWPNQSDPDSIPFRLPIPTHIQPQFMGLGMTMVIHNPGHFGNMRARADSTASTMATAISILT